MTKRALLVGINYVNNDADTRLTGCIEDVENIKEMLITKLGYSEEDIMLLKDTDAQRMPTGKNIYKALRSVIQQSNPNDELWFHY